MIDADERHGAIPLVMVQAIPGDPTARNADYAGFS
jgi:hypothetical protein